ncbi:MAG TPA: OB-fold nucleic acid binding domain-containing protein [Pyrinomonadaceae bacterium]|nr:OB-fold nucleic acid binding domain-containing protein [Pyrinomonadaceae bacterium]
MMAVLEDSIQLIRDSYGEEVDLAHLPPDDKGVYEALQKADTIGLFQVESRAQMSCLPRLRPAKFYDIVVQVAIIRPGPIVGNMVHPYLKRRQGREPVTYAHPSLKPILERTLGVPLFQEQLLRMAMVCAGFTGGQAEELRRAFGFKRSEARMKAIEVKLRKGLQENGIAGKTQDEIVLAISSFALYGFPESHAASFALLAYASAYLKCNYLAAFTTAMLNNQPMGFYQPFTLVKDAQRHGLRVLPIDIMRSDWLCTIEETPETRHAMRLGLRYVKGLSQQAGQAIVRERSQRPFTGIDDVCNRVPELRKGELRKLAAIGALNFIQDDTVNRRDALWQVERVKRVAGELYEELAEKDGDSPLLPMSVTERLDADFRGTGMTIGKHPVAYHRDELNKLDALRAIDIRKLRDGSFVRVAGWVIVRQRPGTAKGFMFLTLEDETGVSNIIVTPQLFDRYRIELVDHPFLLIEGALQNQDNVISVKAHHVQPLSFKVAATQSHDFH